jgi:alkylation response protein AidB-like acyl-CoA dehydrogenase
MGGGIEGDHQVFFSTIYEIARACGSTALIYGNPAGAARFLLWAAVEGGVANRRSLVRATSRIADDPIVQLQVGNMESRRAAARLLV